MAVLVVNHGIIQCIIILSAVLRAMTKFDIYTLRNGICQEVKWMLDVHLQLSTLLALELCHVHHLPYALLHENATYCLPEAIQ
jgi:hypothetical protein